MRFSEIQKNTFFFAYSQNTNKKMKKHENTKKKLMQCVIRRGKTYFCIASWFGVLRPRIRWMLGFEPRSNTNVNGLPKQHPYIQTIDPVQGYEHH